MLKKIRAILYPFPKGIWFNNADESKGVIYNSFKEELKDWRFWVVIGIFALIIWLAWSSRNAYYPPDFGFYHDIRDIPRP